MIIFIRIFTNQSIKGGPIMIFRCLKDFYEKDGTLKILQLNDTIIIAEIEYKVWSFTLSRVYARDPNKIFKVLFIEDKEKFCGKYYGYNKKPEDGFPHFHDYDFNAATRVVIALMKRWEKCGCALGALKQNT